ncbi:dual specificity protein phosphatase [Cystobacter fuscus]|uniref:Dual specificity protein phosphatase n=1 Tax=Cystobacter fuscus TaxID=43 RepID=A0A250JD07_9BACT|nr:hypothetical protein [Cystobacter fuscus]ATB41775.1 dual specificity protein phosphatase [Cystobacter fuscus]
MLVSRGYSPLEALALAKRRRPKVSPSPEQLEAFMAFAEEWRRVHGASWTVPVFDALAAIAYSHLRPSSPPPA